MSEDFKPIRITLSNEAFAHLDKVMNDAKFRSYSSTIEECIRAINDIISEIHYTSGKKGKVTIPVSDVTDSWDRILMRMYRFTGRRPSRPYKEK